MFVDMGYYFLKEIDDGVEMVKVNGKDNYFLIFLSFSCSKVGGYRSNFG